MEPLVYMMAILGCGDGRGPCLQARMEQVRYTSLQACQAAAPAALMRHTDLDFPELAARCRAVGTRLVAKPVPRPKG